MLSAIPDRSTAPFHEIPDHDLHEDISKLVQDDDHHPSREKEPRPADLQQTIAEFAKLLLITVVVSN